MRCRIYFKARILIIAIAFLCGCRPLSDQDSIGPVSTPDTVTTATSVVIGNPADNDLLLHTLSGHNGRVLDVVFSAQSELLASSGQDLNIRLWDVMSGKEEHSFRMRSVDMADMDLFLAGNLLASAETIWDLDSRAEIQELERGSQVPGFVAFSPDGSLLALGLFEQQISLWDVSRGELVYTFDRQEENRTKRMDFSPDGDLLAVGVYDGTVRLLDLESGDIVKVLKYHGETDIHDLVFSPDGKYLATGGRVPAVILWDVSSGEVIRTFPLTDNAISMDFSPDGKILATSGGYENEVRLWDVESGNLLHSLPHNEQLSSVAFSPDGRLLAAGCFDGNIYLWEISVNH